MKKWVRGRVAENGSLFCLSGFATAKTISLIAAQCPVVDHRFDCLNHLTNLLSTKESIRGNDLK